MPYWGTKPADNDYAFDALGAYLFLIKERMFKDMAIAIEKAYPEQSILASLQFVRLVSAGFPKCVNVHFRKKELQLAKTGFAEWYEVAKGKIPAEYRHAILSEADREFDLFEKQVLS
jgi:hypothetical protein